MSVRLAGYLACVGSHKAHGKLPRLKHESLDAGEGLLTHVPMTRGSVLFFMGGSQIHGAAGWRARAERRVVLQFFSSADSRLYPAPARAAL